MFGMFLFFFSCVIFLLSRAIFVVKQQWSYIIERFGKFHEVANPGLNIKVLKRTGFCSYLFLRGLGTWRRGIHQSLRIARCGWLRIV